MSGEYRKYTVKMEVMNDSYRLWKSRECNCRCVIEAYKEKRSVYFSVDNLMPSATLLSDSNREYRLMLMGADGGEIIHKDFGSYFVNQRGEGGFFKKFNGPEPEKYTHCLLVSADKAGGKAETVMSGQMPFYQKEEKSEKPAGFDEIWGETFAAAGKTKAVIVFSDERDETGAIWYRAGDLSGLPGPLDKCSKQIQRYGHYIVGRKNKNYYVGVPGRFLRAEQPLKEERTFLLWQPIRGGERFFKELSDMTEKLQEEIFGYWIAGIDASSGGLLPL